MNRILFTLTICLSSSAFAMDSAVAIETYRSDDPFDQCWEVERSESFSPQMQLRLKHKSAITLSDEQRKQLGAVYGKTFSSKILFFKVAAFAACAHFGFHGPDFNPCNDRPGCPAMPQLPEYISYDDIKDIKEGAILRLTLFGKEYPICCMQNDRWQPFERVVQQYLPKE